MNGLDRPIDTTNGLKLLGERNSGTNLLDGLMSQVPELKLFPSIPILRQRDMPLFRRPWAAPLNYKAAHEATLDDWHLRDLPRSGGWKHAAPDAAFRSQFLDVHAPAVLIIVRHPAVWLRSMHRNPFHSLNPVPRNFSKFIRQEWLCVGRDCLDRRSLPNLPGLQDAKVLAYADLLSQYPNSTLIRYEDLAKDPTGTLSKIGIKFPPQAVVPDGDARTFANRQASGTNYTAAASQASDAALSATDAAFVRQVIEGSPLATMYPD